MFTEVAIPKESLEAFCVQRHIRGLSLFGSVLTPRFRPDSDVDVLVEFEPGHVPGFLGLAQMELELGAMFGSPARPFRSRWRRPACPAGETYSGA